MNRAGDAQKVFSSQVIEPLIKPIGTIPTELRTAEDVVGALDGAKLFPCRGHQWLLLFANYLGTQAGCRTMAWIEVKHIEPRFLIMRVDPILRRVPPPIDGRHHRGQHAEPAITGIGNRALFGPHNNLEVVGCSRRESRQGKPVVVFNIRIVFTVTVIDRFSVVDV